MAVETATELTVIKGSALTGINSGNSPQAIDATNGNKFLNNGKVRLHIFGSASASADAKVTVKGGRPCSRGSIHDETTATGALDSAAEELILGPFDPNRFNQGGYVEIQFSGTTTGITMNPVEEV